MEITFLNKASFEPTLLKLMKKSSEFHWAVAWATMNDIAKTLFRHSHKFRHVTFGVAFSQTDPDFVDKLVGIANAKVATKFKGGTYHPKIYGFRSGDEAAAIIGSANFTRGGLRRNHEATVLVTGSAAERFFTDLFEFASESAALGELVSPEFATSYRRSCERADSMPKPPRDPVPTLHASKGKPSPVVTMTWAEYAKNVKSKSNIHDVATSLELLLIAQGWFSVSRSFSDLALEERQAIAGTLPDSQKSGKKLDRDWGWFGSMRGAGEFAKLINSSNVYLTRAVDSIPQKGDVTELHYKRFVKLFLRAFRNATRSGRVATATRLLAMKRPDVFFCVCGPNIERAADLFGFSKSSLNLENYWTLVMNPIRRSSWYNHEKPDGADGTLWESRVAMLDTMLYRKPDVFDLGPNSRLDEMHARNLALLVAASMPGRTATTDQLIENAPKFWKPSKGDLAQSLTRPNQPKWHQIMRNVISHSESAVGPFVLGYAARTEDGLSVTEKGLRYLGSIGLRPEKAPLKRGNL